MRDIGVLIRHQPHHGWILPILSNLSTTTLHLRHHPSPRTTRNDADTSPSPSGCGLNQHRLSSLRSEVPAPAALPLSKGMWVGSDSLDGAAREGNRQVGAELFVPPQFDLFRFDEGHLSNRKWCRPKGVKLMLLFISNHKWLNRKNAQL